jgi:predicted RNA methylase
VVFKNGNAHVWFKRDDLLEKVNLLLAEHYGAALGAGAGRRRTPRMSPTAPRRRTFGFFETPEPVIHRLLEAAMVGTYAGVTPLMVLEPSAGLGALARPMLAAGHHVTCIEIHPERAAELRGLHGLKRVIRGDFFDQLPSVLGRFDRIVMNPPFDGGRDIDHVTHALEFLRPGGRLAAVMSAGVEFRQDRKATDFRALVERMGGQFCDLPPGSFAEVGTNVNTCIVTLAQAADPRSAGTGDAR